MAKKIAIKIDVDTKRGYDEGVPRMLDVFKQENIKATFFFSMGTDNSGKAIRRIFRKGFLTKMLRTKAPSTYGFKTMMYGTILPAPHIVEPNPMPFLRAIKENHECGIHCWDHVYWQDKLPFLSEDTIKEELTKAINLFEKIAGFKAKACAAPGWQVTPRSLKVQQELGFDYCSDVRGYYPFYPVMNDKKYLPLQIPGTLLTMDECLGSTLDNKLITEENINDYWLSHCDQEFNVLTIHSEMEGLKQLPILHDFIKKAKKLGYHIIFILIHIYFFLFHWQRKSAFFYAFLISFAITSRNSESCGFPAGNNTF